MPPILAITGLLPALIGAGVTGVTTGLEASGAIGGGGGPSQATQQQEQLQQQEAAQKQKEQQLQETFKHFASNAQEASGGGLDAGSFAALVDQYAGQPGTIGSAQEAIFGSTPTPGLSGG